MFKSQLFKNLSSLTLIQLANYAIPILLIPYISRIIGIENYGKLEYTRTLVFYFTILIDYGFNYTATRDIAANREDNHKLNVIVLEVYSAKFILFLIASLIFYFLIFFDKNLHDISALLWVTYLINIGFFLFPMWFFQGVEKISKIAYINFSVKLLVISMVFFFIKSKEDFWVYNGLQSASQILAGFIALFLMYKIYGFRFSLISFENVFQRLKNGFYVFLSTILVTIFASYSFILLKKTGSNVEIGIYSTAFKLAITIQTIIVIPFSQAFFPFMAKQAKENIYTFVKYIKRATKVLLTLTVLFSAVSFLFAELIISILFGEDYLTAVYAFRVLSFLPVFSVLNNLFSYQGLLNLKKDKVFLNLHVFFTVLTIILAHILVPKYGLGAVLYLRVVTEMLLMLASFILFRKYLKLRL